MSSSLEFIYIFIIFVLFLGCILSSILKHIRAWRRVYLYIYTLCSWFFPFFFVARSVVHKFHVLPNVKIIHTHPFGFLQKQTAARATNRVNEKSREMNFRVRLLCNIFLFTSSFSGNKQSEESNKCRNITWGISTFVPGIRKTRINVIPAWNEEWNTHGPCAAQKLESNIIFS